MWAEVDEDGYHHQLLHCIVDHKSDKKAVKIGDEWITSKSGKKTWKKITRGWYLKIQLKDGSTSWKPLKDVKEAQPVALANYTKTVGIVGEQCCLCLLE